MTYDPRIPTDAPTVPGSTTVIMGKKDDIPLTTLVPPLAGAAFTKPAAAAPTPAPTPAPAAVVVAPKKAAVKKTVAKKPAVKKKPAAKRVKLSTDDIALRAYFISEHRHKHGLHGDAHSDWVEAERQLKKELKKKKA
jgi:hypothetical protein